MCVKYYSNWALKRLSEYLAQMIVQLKIHIILPSWPWRTGQKKIADMKLKRYILFLIVKHIWIELTNEDDIRSYLTVLDLLNDQEFQLFHKWWLSILLCIYSCDSYYLSIHCKERPLGSGLQTQQYCGRFNSTEFKNNIESLSSCLHLIIQLSERQIPKQTVCTFVQCAKMIFGVSAELIFVKLSSWYLAV